MKIIIILYIYIYYDLIHDSFRFWLFLLKKRVIFSTISSLFVVVVIICIEEIKKKWVVCFLISLASFILEVELKFSNLE
jgi:hypothetical protein